MTIRTRFCGTERLEGLARKHRALRFFVADKWAIALCIGEIECMQQNAEIHPAKTTGHRAGRTSDEPDLDGELVFLSAEEQAQRSIELLGAGALLVTLPPPVLSARGRLGELLEELVERELARLGAPSPYLAAWSAMPEDATARLADQLSRARAVGGTGIALAMGSLGAIGRPSLTPDDSTTLRWLADASLHAPLVLLVDDADMTLLGWPTPLPLAGLLSRPRIVLPSPSAPVVWEEAACVPAVATDFTPSVPIDTIDAADDTEEEEPMILVGDDVTQVDARVAAVEIASIEIADAILLEVARPTLPPEELEAVLAQDRVEVDPEPVVLDAAPEADDAPPDPVVAPPRRGRRRTPLETVKAVERVTVGIPVTGPSDAWRSWAIALGAAKGAQPLSAFERLFTESYIPLTNAIAAGLDDARALRAHDEFRRGFERTYTDAFATFGATNRRPRLVMDAYDVASKQARLANARQTHVLVVDSMRYDLGCLVREALIREASGIATLGAESLLWSALPSTTMRQLETLARGMDALRDPAREEPSESLRGRAAEVVRRVRLGSRELYKLDLIPAMLDEMATGTGREQLEPAAAFQRIGDVTAEAIARHISTLAPRTYLFILGDHGFSVDRRGAVQLGGASPEEVLVPSFGVLVGDLH